MIVQRASWFLSETNWFYNYFILILCYLCNFLSMSILFCIINDIANFKNSVPETGLSILVDLFVNLSFTIRFFVVERVSFTLASSFGFRKNMDVKSPDVSLETRRCLKLRQSTRNGIISVSDVFMVIFLRVSVRSKTHSRIARNYQNVFFLFSQTVVSKAFSSRTISFFVKITFPKVSTTHPSPNR